MKTKIYSLLISTIVLCSFNSCVPSIKRAYTKIVKPCTTNDLSGKTLFFGPANNLGPGDVLRKQSRGGYGLSFRLPRLVDSEQERTSMIDVSNEGTCKGVAKLSKKLSGKVSAKDYVGKPEASATLSTAENITTKITSFKWITLEQTVFEQKVDALDDDSRLLSSILDNNTFVITRALLVNGLNVTYSFEQAVSAEAQAKFDQLDTGLSGNWTNNTTFELTVSKPFYIAGELSSYREDGLSSLSTKFSEPIEISDDAEVFTDNEMF